MLKHVTIDQRDIKIYHIASRMSSCDDSTYNPIPPGINKLELPIKDNAKLFRRKKEKKTTSNIACRTNRYKIEEAICRRPTHVNYVGVQCELTFK